MNEFAASRTALSTALMRALHTRLDPEPLLDDPWGERLVPSAARTAYSDESLLNSPAFANVITRSRYTEDALRAAVAAGVTQYVLIGAGFDSFALRRPDFSRNLSIFEVDHPATQALKLRQIAACGITLPATVHFIAADLAQESLASALARSPFNTDARSFFSWLGVSMYLTREANLATFRAVASSAPSGSRLAFTYMEARTLASQSEAFRQIQTRLSALGEPFLSGFDPQTLGQELSDCGLKLLEDLGGLQVAERYGRIGQRAFERHSTSHVALAQC